jgi:hypothetical protein
MDQEISKVAGEGPSPDGPYELPRLTRVGSLRELLAGSTVSGTPDGAAVGHFRKVGMAPPGM